MVSPLTMNFTCFLVTARICTAAGCSLAGVAVAPVIGRGQFDVPLARGGGGVIATLEPAPVRRGGVVAAGRVVGRTVPGDGRAPMV